MALSVGAHFFLVSDTRCRLGEVLSNDDRKRRPGPWVQEDTGERGEVEQRNKEENIVHDWYEQIRSGVFPNVTFDAGKGAACNEAELAAVTIKEAGERSPELKSEYNLRKLAARYVTSKASKRSRHFAKQYSQLYSANTTRQKTGIGLRSIVNHEPAARCRELGSAGVVAKISSNISIAVHGREPRT
ncbi:hypothetical protein WN55_03206 [Dufourea novaeangliae]|uniref:Uncharacterized protein n=1 Tax=Dufourea novaeangliae TaxID=178035 RepID=A0A154PJW7_DUFNO|nr:hypothetical protein WN55_03206 [Dufourea novaeangliae]